MLYTLITFGVSFDPAVESDLDLPDHMMRLRLVLTILDTCGVYFSSGLSRKRLDYYLYYLQVNFSFQFCFFQRLFHRNLKIKLFQYYYLFKRSLPIWTEDNPFPVAVDFGMKDTLSTLRPKLKPYKSFQEAADAVENLEKELMKKLSQAVGFYPFHTHRKEESEKKHY